MDMGTDESAALPSDLTANTRRRIGDAQVGKTIACLGKLSLRMKNHSHLTVARHLCEKTHVSMLVVTIRQGEE